MTPSSANETPASTTEPAASATELVAVVSETTKVRKIRQAMRNFDQSNLLEAVRRLI